MQTLSVTESNDLAFLWRHAWAYADTFPRNDGDKCDAYASWYIDVYGEGFIVGGSAPEHSNVYHAWSDDYAVRETA